MVDPMDDIVRQARQGSVSAIIQVLNDKLAASGVRTRAIFEQGILQLLCEGATPQQLEQSVLVPQVRQILEMLQPRYVRRVNINSRIVREQQLLWLDEINRDPENQLLWSEEITLKKPKLFQRLQQDWKDAKPELSVKTLPKASPLLKAREKRVFWRGLVGGASLSIFLLMLGWAIYQWLGPKLSLSQANVSSAGSPSSAASSTVATSSASSTASPSMASDPFAEAVRLAQTTVSAGQKARTSADWLAVAADWQRASDLMRQVPTQDSRYATAQDRITVYQRNSQMALQKAKSNS